MWCNIILMEHYLFAPELISIWNSMLLYSLLPMVLQFPRCSLWNPLQSHQIQSMIFLLVRLWYSLWIVLQLSHQIQSIIFLLVKMPFITLPTGSPDGYQPPFWLVCWSKSTFYHKWWFCPEFCPCIDIQADYYRCEHVCFYLLEAADAALSDWICTSS